MSEPLTLPTRNARGLTVVSIPQRLFGKRVILQAHTITTPVRKDHVLDGHDCHQVKAKEDVVFFSSQYKIN